VEERVAIAGVLDVAHLHRLKPRKLLSGPGLVAWPCNSKEMVLMAITKESLVGWIHEAIQDDRNFKTEDPNPEAQRAKTMILEIIQKLRGRVL